MFLIYLNLLSFKILYIRVLELLFALIIYDKLKCDKISKILDRRLKYEEYRVKLKFFR